MKRLFLHIGAGKTGSSALQVWLSQNKKQLKDEGIYYPEEQELEDYSISSGNGFLFINTLKNNLIEEYLIQLFNKNDQVLFSSEVFQTLNIQEIELINQLCKSLEIDLRIIIYLRDIYDVVYSLYLQTIKRHSMQLSFEEYIFSLNDIEQFNVLDKFELAASNIFVLHYDTEKKHGIELSFCEALSINHNNLNKMKKNKVNRSLSVIESELMRISNILYNDKIKLNPNLFCTRVSDKLIYSNPELETGIYYNTDIENYLKSKYQSKIDTLNYRYLKPNQLKIFDKNNKMIVENNFDYLKEFEYILSVIIDEFKRDTLKEKLLINDSRIVEVLRDYAITIEKESPEKALSFMKVASILRPNGPVIEKKLKEYMQLTKNL